ncbi:3-keto sterol reductase [Mycena crocata]|nr:3-keto sterol reductase [Mycena crocata]
MSSWPVVVVTGANAGVGLGICRRLLFQLCVSNPPDSWPQPWAHAPDTHGSPESLRGDGLTLIMACRSTARAEAARKQLYVELDAHIAELRRRPGYDGHADVFRRNAKIEIEYVDFAVLSTVFDFAAQISKRHSYVSHLICNAGVANFTHIEWIPCITQLARNFLEAITRPEFYAQSVGELSVDGLGWVWQSNLFGHYVLFRTLQPLLQSPIYPAESRIIWSSSLEASPKFYDEADWQLTKTAHSYESVKYQIDLIVPLLDRQTLQDPSSAKQTRHFVSHPGVCHTKISTNLVTHGGLLDTLKVLSFYMGRIIFGSRHHPISAMNAAICAVHLVLVSISFITFTSSNGNASGPTSVVETTPVKFGAQTDRWGNPQVGITPIQQWKENETHGEMLVERCEKLFRDFSEKRGTPAS